VPDEPFFKQVSFFQRMYRLFARKISESKGFLAVKKPGKRAKRARTRTAANGQAATKAHENCNFLKAAAYALKR